MYSVNGIVLNGPVMYFFAISDQHWSFLYVGHIQVPPGLTICKSELGDIAGAFLRLINYNKSVFGDFYNQIIENHCIFQVEA